MADANLLVKIGALVDSSFDRATKNAVNRIKAFGGEISAAGSSLALGITAPIAAFGAAAIKAGGDIQALKLSLQSLEGSTAGAERRFKELLEVAKLPGLGVKEAIQADLALRGYGLSAERAKEATLAFGNALAAAGRGKADLAETIRQFGQLATSAKLTSENIKPIIERTPQAATILREAFGTANAEALRDLGVTTQQVVDTLITGLQKVPPVTGGLKNALENFSDSTEQALARVGDALTPFVTRFLNDFAEPAIQKITDLATQFSKLTPQTQNFALAATGLAAGLPLVAVGLGKIVAIGTEVVALFAKFPALGLAALGVGAAAATKVAYDNIEEVNNQLLETERIREALSRGELKLPKLTGKESYEEFLAKLKEINQVFFERPWEKGSGIEGALKDFKAAGGTFDTGLKVITKSADAAGDAVKKAGKKVKEFVSDAIPFGQRSLQNAIILERFGGSLSDAARRGAELQKALEQLNDAPAGEGDRIARLQAVLDKTSLKGGPLDGIFASFSDRQPFQFFEDNIELAKARTADLVAEISKIPGETRLVEEAWARVGLEIGRTKVPDDLKYFQAEIFKTASESVKKGAKDFEKAQKDQERAAREAQRHIERVFHQTARAITDVIFQSDSLGQAFTKLGRELLKSLATEAIERQLKRLTKTLLDWGAELGKTGLGKVLGGLFGADLSKGGGLIIKNATGAAAGAAGSVAGSAASVGGSAAGAAGQVAGSALSAAVGVVTGVVSAVSGVISNFQLAGVNKSLDLIEHEVRYSQIHLLHILENSNKFWPWIQYSHDRLRQMLEAGVPVFNAAGDQGLRIAGGGGGQVINIDLRGSTFGGGTTQEAVEEMFTTAARRLALAGGVAG